MQIYLQNLFFLSAKDTNGWDLYFFVHKLNKWNKSHAGWFLGQQLTTMEDNFCRLSLRSPLCSLYSRVVIPLQVLEIISVRIA